MRRIWFFLFLFLGPLFGDMKPLVFAPLPMKDESTIYRTFAPMIHYLEVKLGRKINYHISQSYSDLIEAIIDGKIDLTYLGPLPYIISKQSNADLKPLVVFNENENQTTYACVLVAWAPEKEGYNLVNLDQNSTTIALTSPLSTCGYFGVEGMLRRSNHTLEKINHTFLGKHDEVALSVVRGEYVYGGLKEGIARQYAHLGLEVVARLDDIPGFALIIDSSRVEASLGEKISTILLETKEEVYSHWGDGINKGVHPASDAMYESFERIILQSTWRPRL